MKNVFIIILTIILIAPFPFACNKHDFYQYDIESLGIEIGRFSKTDSRIFEKFTFNDGDTLQSSEFIIRISIDKVKRIAALTTPISLFHSNALAETPLPVSFKLGLISISSSNSVFASGKEFEPASNLTSLFEASFEYYDQEYMTILQFIDSYDQWYKDDKILLKLSTPLDKPLAQKLKVIVTMDDGTVFELETEKVVVK
jgi:hypothetical protein